MLFQKNILKKYAAALHADTLKTAWKRYSAYFLDTNIQQNIKQSKEEQFQEGFLRELFVKVLGYTLNPSPNYNLITEQKNQTNARKADGAILLNGKVIGVIELKDLKTTDLAKVEPQAFNYKSQHANARLVIISNFEKLRLYIDNAVEHREWNLFQLSEADFGELYLCLTWEQVERGVAIQMKQESVSSEDQITQALYNDYSQFKQALLANMLKNNAAPQGTDEKEWHLLLFKKTQKLLDRLLFIFFAEDGGLLPPNLMMTIIEEWDKLRKLDEYKPLYARIKKHFEYLNTGYKGDYEIFAYNGGLFKPDDVLDSLSIDDDVLHEHTRNLSTYDFQSEVDVNILGHIFEHSLTEIDAITTKLQHGEAPVITKNKKGKSKNKIKDGKRKKDGVFYTPPYITKYIVENTVGKLCREKKDELGIDESDYFADKKRQAATKKALIAKLETYREWLLQISICDPACGSGAFLNAALNFLIAEHRLIDELQAKVYGASIVFPNVENSILENNLYGVDINEESVEIAKLSLWLRTAQPHRKLNSLSSNIKCGNSLINTETMEHKTRGHAPLSKPDEQTAVARETRGHAPLSLPDEKAFCWEKEFPKVFREKTKKAWHITTAVHDSRTSGRMVEYEVRRLRNNGTRPYPEPMLLSEEEEIIITETVAKIVEEDKLNVLAYNICFDHMHLLLVCEEEEVSKIMGKIKSMTARAVNIAMGRTVPMVRETRGHDPLSKPDEQTAEARETRGHDPLSKPNERTAKARETRGHAPLSKPNERGHTQCSLWAQKFGCTSIDSNEHLYKTIEYIQNNRAKHELPPIDKGACPLAQVPIVSFEEAFRPEYTGGFDVVIGNPPYVQLQTMGEMSDVYEKCGYEVYNKTADLYCLFYERGCQLLKKKGLLGFIASNKWLKVNYGIQLRKYLTTNANPYILIDFPGVHVFEDATVDPQILLLSKEPYSGKTFACTCKQTSDIALFIEGNKKETTFGEDAWTIPDESSAIFEKMNNGIALKDLPITINYGIKTGFNDAFFIDGATRSRLIAEDPKSAELIKPLLRGRDIQAWVPDLVDQYLIGTLPALQLEVDNYPAIKKHLLSFGIERLEQSGAKGARKKTPNKWFETQDTISYYKEFSKPKIMYPNMTKYLPFIYDETGYFGNDKTFIITSQDDSFSLKSLVAILNSKLAKLWIRRHCPELGEDRREIRKVYFENFPIPIEIIKTTDANLASEIDKGACPLVPTSNLPTKSTNEDCASGIDKGACPLVSRKLSALADQMLDLNQQLQQKRSRFLRLLQENINIQKITAALERFEELDFKAFMAELKKQKIKLTLSQQDEWMEFFDQYSSECQQLKTQIETTDKQIDKMVYELYGLTDEEIRVVEGN